MKLKNKWLIVAGLAVVAGLIGLLAFNRNTQAQHFTAKVRALCSMDRPCGTF